MHELSPNSNQYKIKSPNKLDESVESIFNHVNDLHRYPGDLPDTLFDLIAADTKLPQDKMEELISKVNLWLFNKVKKYDAGLDEINSICIIGYISCLNILFPYYDFSNFLARLKTNEVFIGIAEYSISGQQRNLNLYIERFTNKLTYKLNHLAFNPEDNELIRNTMKNILSERLERQMKLVYRSQISENTVN